MAIRLRKSISKWGKQQSRQTCRNTPLTHAKTRIAGTYNSFLLIKFADSLLKVYAYVAMR